MTSRIALVLAAVAGSVIIGITAWWAARRAEAPAGSASAARTPVPAPALPAAVPAAPGAIDPEIAQRIAEATAGVESDPQNPAAWRRLAMTYDANDLFERARDCYERAVELDPSEPRTWFLLGCAAERCFDPEAAATSFRSSIALRDGAAPQRRLGFVLLELGDAGGAESAFSAALRRDPADDAARIGLARVHLQRGEAEGAARILEKIAEGRSPNASYARQLLARAWRQLGRTEDAETAALQGEGAVLVEDDPWRREVAALRAGLTWRVEQAAKLCDERRHDEAVALIEGLLRDRPGEVAVLTAAGAVYLAAGRRDESIAVLEQALALRPGYYPAHLEIARAYSAGDPADDRALAHVDEALALDPALGAAHGLRGSLLKARGDGPGAATAFVAAARLDPANATWPYRAAAALIQTQRWQEAADILLTLTRREPGAARAWALLGEAQMNLGKLDDADASIKRAAALAPTEPMVHEALRKLRLKRRPA
jgi:tetratricopeptide (TPR) repeat protein